MTISASFFDQVKYPAQEFINRDADFIGNGVLHPSTDFGLAYPGGMNININTLGTAWVNGRRIAYDANPILNLSLVSADTTNPRIDLIEVGYTGVGTQGAGVIKIVTGIPQANPLQPQPDSGFIALYAVRVNVGVTSVSAANVTDLRTGVTISGAATTPLSSSVPGTQITNTTGSPGVSTNAARADHVHPMPNITPVVATAKNVKLTSTSATNVVTYTPNAQDNFEIDVYLRVVTGTANVTVTITYADDTGPQTKTMLYQFGGLYFPCSSGAQSYGPGSYPMIPLFIDAVAGTPIAVTVTASVANQVYVSSSIVGV